jgi:ATP-dependent protease ClpP protease subunit
MHQNRLQQLLAHNARKGEFRAEGNTIYVYDVIVTSDADAEWFGGVSAESFVKALRGMQGDVQLRINSPGGDVFGAVGMMNAIREYPGKVTAHVEGYAASAASFLTSAADETVMAAGSMLMIHKAWTIGFGNSDDLMATAALLEKIDGNIVKTYQAGAERRGVTPADFEELMRAETWLNGDEAVALGLADSVADPTAKDLTARAQARWDLSAYDHAPAALGPAPEPEPVIEASEPEPEIEQPLRPNVAHDLLLRPAA